MTDTLQTARGPIPKPKVGDGATICFFSDCRAATVIKVSPSGKTVWVQKDNYFRTDSNGMSEDQEYRFERDPEGAIYEFTLRANGRFIQRHHTMRSGTALAVGYRYCYYDFSF